MSAQVIQLIGQATPTYRPDRLGIKLNTDWSRYIFAIKTELDNIYVVINNFVGTDQLATGYICMLYLKTYIL